MATIQHFRTALGGFNRQDVMEYIEKTQKEAAEKIGVSGQAVSKWENGNTMPDVTMIPAIASFEMYKYNTIFEVKV